MTAYKVGAWITASRILRSAPGKIDRALTRAVLAEAHLFRRKVVEGFRTQAPGGKPFKPPSPNTLKIRKFKNFGGTKSLIVRGDLRNSVVIRPIGRAAAFVGVMRGSKSSDGKDLVNIAAVHEFGAGPIVLRVTPKMIAFLGAAGILDGSGGGGGGGTGIIVIRIPARPFLRPVRDRWFTPALARARFLSRIAGEMQGDFGSGPRSVGGIRRRTGPAARDPVTGRFISRS